MPRHTRRSVLRLAAAGGASSLLGAGHDAHRTQSPPTPQTNFVTPATQTAIDQGLAFLARSQKGDGGFAGEGTPDGTEVGVAALAGLALLAGGHHPGRGRYGRTVSRVADYVLASADAPGTGFLVAPGARPTGTEAWNQKATYSHAFGCLFLGELCGTLPDPARQKRARAALERAVGFTVRARAADGGWRYAPQPPYSDVSVTATTLMALRAARNAGTAVPKDVVEAGAKFLLACQRPDGGFGYTRSAGDASQFARSAAALVGLFSAGTYSGPEVEKGLKHVLRFRPGRALTQQELSPAYYFYAHYYAALAMWTAGGGYWSSWAPAARGELLSRARDGVWEDRSFGPVYATAVSLLVLQLTDHYLPALQA